MATSSPYQRIILYDVSWQTYESLLANYVDCPVPRFTFDRGSLEILANLPMEHERVNRTVASLVEYVALEQELDFRNFGSIIFTRKDLERGFEPDTCF